MLWRSFPLTRNKASGKKGSRRVFILHGRKANSFFSIDSELKSLVANAVPESTRKSTKHAVNVFEGEESYKHTLEI